MRIRSEIHVGDEVYVKRPIFLLVHMIATRFQRLNSHFINNFFRHMGSLVKETYVEQKHLSKNTVGLLLFDVRVSDTSEISQHARQRKAVLCTASQVKANPSYLTAHQNQIL